MKEINGNTIFADGDVLPRADDFDGIEEYRQKEPNVDADIRGHAMRSARIREQSIKNLHAGEKDKTPRPQIHIPREVMDLMIDAAKKEDELRGYGASETRIASKVGKPLTIGMIKLQINGIDTSNAYGSSQHDKEDNIRELDPRREARIEALMEGAGMSYDEASKRA